MVKEEKPPAGYRRKEERREVTLKAGEKEKLVFVNMENEIVLKKQSEKGEPLEGAVFQVWKGEEAVSYTHLDVYKRQGQRSLP